MPRLTTWQWLAAVAFLLFYGFAVFALTRDYYLRNPPQPVAASSAPAGHQPGGTRTWLQEQLDGPTPDLEMAVRGRDPTRLGELADDLFGEGRYAEALPLYRRLIELEPDDVEAHNDLGLALHYAGSSADALEVLEAGAAKGPEHQRIWLTLGFVRAATGQVAAARDALSRARTLDPESPVGQEAQRLLSGLDQG